MLSGGRSKQLYQRWRERQVLCPKQLKFENNKSFLRFMKDSKLFNDIYVIESGRSEFDR